MQLPKNADPENPHKHWVFGPCYSYAVAAEQKARATYEHLMQLTDDPELLNPLRFLREREIVHFQRFGECLEILKSIEAKCPSRLDYSRMGTFKHCPENNRNN